MRFIRRLVVVCALAGAALVAWTAAGDASEGEEVVTLKIVMLPYLSYAPLFIAEDGGHLARHGIQLERVRLTGSTDGLPALATGRIDVLPGFITPGFFNLIGRGANLRFVADKGHAAADGCAYRGILARKTLVEAGELETLATIAGKTIATERTSPSYYDIDRLLERAGLTIGDIEVVDVPPAAKLDAFATGAIDLTTSSEPWITRIVDAGHAVLWRHLRDYAPGYQHSFILYGPNLLEKNRDVGVRFMAAYLEALRQYAEGKTDENVAIVARHTGLPEDVVARACWAPVRADGTLDTDALLDYQRWALATDLLDEVVPTGRFFDATLLEDARARLGDRD